MKNSFKSATLLVALVGITAVSKAQIAPQGIRFSVGVESGLSLGDFKDTHKTNIGGSLQADIPMAKQWYATANVGYTNFFGRDNVLGSGYSATDLHLLPVMAGIKYFPLNILYLQADAGAAFALNKSEVGYSSTTAFLYVPQIGVQFPIGGKSYLDGGVRYEGTSSFDGNDTHGKVNQIGIRIAYGFGLK